MADKAIEGRKGSAPGARVRVANAVFPKPFPYQLEYNCPVHENWNIVHTGMLIPETHAIYVCSDNCVRGVIMTADEWNGQSRFSAVMPTEKDTIDGRLEQVTIDGVSHVIDRLPYRPKAVQVFLVCMHHFLGCDERYIYRELSKRYPDIHFMRCWMDPIMQKTGLTPEQKQRREMMLCLASYPSDERKGVVLGDDYRLPDSSDIVRLLSRHGIELHQVQDAASYQEYADFGDAAFGITRTPLSWYGLQQWARRDEKRCAYLPPFATYDEIKEELQTLLQTALPEIQAADIQAEVEEFAQAEIVQTEEAFSRAKELIGDCEIQLDFLGCVMPLSTAALLLSHGFNVTTVYADVLMPEEEATFRMLQAEYPDLVLQSTKQAEALVIAGKRPSLCAADGGVSAEGASQENDEANKVLAIGPKAAFFADTPYFVNQIESDGNWGFDGIRKLLTAMSEAFCEKKDTEALVTRKGLREDGSYRYEQHPMPMEEGCCSQPRSAMAGKACSVSEWRESLRRDTYRITPVYAGDVSGVCSALYEMGGMVVMHDPSGCNSTYNTHDETRWYRQKSNIYITGFTERDAVLGNDKKFIRDIEDAVAVLDSKPKFIALCNSPVPFLNGTDFPALARLIENDTGIPSFYARTNGMHDYVRGEQEAFLKFAENMLPKPDEASGVVPQESQSAPVSHRSVAILGMTPLDYGNDANADSLDCVLSEAGFEVVSHWSMHSSWDDVQNILLADAILVVSATGIPTAKYLKNTYGIPYVAGAPVGEFREECLHELAKAADGKDYRELCFHRKDQAAANQGTVCTDAQAESASSEHTLYLIGEPVLMGSVGRAIEKASQRSLSANVLCPLEGCENLLDELSGDVFVYGEEDIMNFFALKSAAEVRYLVAADPMYQVILPQEIPFVGIPTLGFSGREYKSDFPDYFDEAWIESTAATIKEVAAWQ